MIRYLLAFLLLCSSVAFAQKAPKLAKNGLPKGARLISVTTDLNKEQLYQKTARVLSEAGFILKASDPALGIIQTGHRKTQGGWWVRVVATVDDNIVKFTGVAAGQRYGGKELVNSNRNKYAFPFAAMNEIAKSVPHTSIEYLP